MASEESTKPTDAAAPAVEQKPEATTKPALGEDDELEDFPVDGAFCVYAWLTRRSADIGCGK